MRTKEVAQIEEERDRYKAECEKLRKLHQDAYQRGFHEGSRGLREAYNAIQEVKRQDAWGNAQLTEAQLAAEGRAERVEIENAALKAENERLSKDVSALVEALKACRDELMWMIERHNQQDQNDGSWLYDYQTVEEADAALAAHRQGGEV